MISRWDPVVLDPFIGSGATAIACIRSGRKYIGFEKHRPHFEAASARIVEEGAQTRFSTNWRFCFGGDVKTAPTTSRRSK